MSSIKINGEKLSMFKEIVATISKLISEGKFVFTDKGLEMVAVDNANVSMCSLNINKEFFDEFLVENGYSCTISTLDFIKLLNRFKEGNVTIEFGQANITIKGKYDDRNKSFNLGIKEDAEDAIKKVPNLEDGTIIKLNTELVSDFLSDVGAYISGDTGISFNFSNKLFTMAADDSTTNSNRLDCPKVDIIREEDNHAKYSSAYINKLMMPKKDGIINYKKDYPLRISYKDKDWNLIYVLAPRVEQI